MQSKNFIKNKRILVTGGAGSIGEELVRQLCLKNKVFIFDINETGTFDLAEELTQKGYWVHYRVGDVRDKETVHDVFSDFKPQVVFHAAAYKHVTPMDVYPVEAINTNILGVYNVVFESKKWDCLEKFVFISTDKAVQSFSVMGASKRFGELLVKNQGKGFVVVRFGNVMGSRGSVIPIWQRQLNKNEPLTITDPKMERYFMTIPQAVGLVIRASLFGKGGEIMVLDMGKKHNIFEAAKSWLEIMRIPDYPVKIIGTRPGESLIEETMFAEEKKRARKEGDIWVIK